MEKGKGFQAFPLILEIGVQIAEAELKLKNTANYLWILEPYLKYP